MALASVWLCTLLTTNSFWHAVTAVQFTDEIFPTVKNLPDGKKLKVSYRCSDQQSNLCKEDISVEFVGFFGLDLPDEHDEDAQKAATRMLTNATGDHYQGTWEVKLEQPPCIRCVATPAFFTTPCPLASSAKNKRSLGSVRKCQVQIVCAKPEPIALSGFIAGSAISSGQKFEVSIQQKQVVCSVGHTL